jgi:hypothetical protein
MAVPPLPATGAILLAVGLVAGCAGAGRAGQAGAGQRPARGPAAPATRPGAGPGCASWPAGSTAKALLITTGSNGQRYCVRPGQTVTVLLSGPLALAGRSQPPRLTGDALAVLPPHVHLPTTPSVSYLAMRPGTAVLTLVGLPCHSLRPAYGAAAPAGTGAGAGARPGAALAECGTRLAVRVTIAVL